MLTKKILIGVTLLVLMLGAVFGGYVPGISGALYYDDFANLENLAGLKGPDAFLSFITSGQAGPLGRPLALASFLIHSSGWPDNSQVVLLVNVLIHLANTATLWLLGYLLLGQLDNSITFQKRFWIALAACWLWAVMPLIASTSLIAIQRMTSLATLFGLMGLAGFVYGYRFASRPLLMFVVQGVSLVGGTLLAIFSKENGALFPVFALVIDIFVVGLTGLRQMPLARLRRLLLCIPLIVILYYLSPLNQNWFNPIDIRGFSRWERFETQWVVMWDYVRYALAPVPSEFGPFHDDWRIVKDPEQLIFAATAWLLLLGGTTLLAIKRITGWPLFAVTWFFVAHLLESTFIALELYFEHRNYIAFYGLCLALAFGVGRVRGSLSKIGPALFVVYSLFQFAVLLAMTNIWGQPLVAAEMWSNSHPASSRAAIHQAFLQVGSADDNVADMNYEYIRRERKLFALERHDRTIEACPECMTVHLEAFRYSCTLTSDQDTQDRLASILLNAPKGRGARASIEILFGLREDINEGTCPSLNRNDYMKILAGLRESPYFQASHFKARLYFLSAASAEDMGDNTGRDRFLRAAEEIEPLAYPVLQYQVTSAIKEGYFDKARAALERRRGYKLNGALTSARFEELTRTIDKAEALTATADQGS